MHIPNYVWILIAILEIITIIIVIIRTNSSSKALAYILLIIGLPVFGIILYFSVGVNFRKQKLYKKKLVINQNQYPELDKRLEKYYQAVLQDNNDKITYFSKLAKKVRREFFITNNNSTELLINGENKFPKLLEDLKNATEHIHLEYYIYANDTIGTEVGEILIQKVKEGVKVRFMYDDFGSDSLRKKYIKKLKENGVEVVPFYKIKWLLFANGINYRDHRKIVVIDGKIGYVGGINVSDKYINNGKNKLYWRDTHVRIEGAAVQALQFTFLTDWNFAAKQNIAFSTDYFPMEKSSNFEGGQVVQIVSAGPDSDYSNIMYAMIQAIMLSKREVLITTPYFIPDQSFIDALKITSMSGVDIKILVPGISDSKFVNLVSNSYYEDLLAAGIEIYKYQKGFVHAKTMICDQLLSFVGTANLDQRSFDLNFEIHSIVYDEVNAKHHAEVFKNDLLNSTQITLSQWKKRSFWQIFLERVARLVSPLI